MNKNINIKDSIIIDSFNKTTNFLLFPRIGWFLKLINWREKELKLLSKNYYVQIDFLNWNNLNNILNNDKSIIIWNPWSWKTQLLVDLFIKIKYNLNKTLCFYYKNEYIPFYIPLRNEWATNLEEYIFKKTAKYNLKWEQKYILILDWLDEISIWETSKILDYIENNQNYKYIISSRKISSNLWELLTKYPNFSKFEIDEFNFNVDIWWNTSILEKYFQDRWKEIDLEKYKKLQIEIKDIFYLEQFFYVYDDLSEKDWKLELTEKFLKKIVNKNNELLFFWIEENNIFDLLTNISENLYKNNTLVLKKDIINEIIWNIISIDNKKSFIDFILKTFFIDSEWGYSFYHKTFYEYFLVKYITNEYINNKLSIREWNILLDSEFILKIFFPYLQKTYLKDENYSWIIWLNFFMSYYLSHNPIDEINSELFTKSLFNLPQEILRYYIFEKTSPIYYWFESFNYCNFSTIKIALETWYKDIADYFYEKINNLLKENDTKKKNIIKKLKLLDDKDKDFNRKKHELEEEKNNLFNWLDFKNQAFIKKHYKQFESFFDVYKTINNNFELNISWKIDFDSNFYNSPYYAFFDDLIKYWNEKDVLEVLKELEKVEFYWFLQVWLNLDNIKNIIWSDEILGLIKEKFLYYNWDFREFINYNKYEFKNNDSAITLFLKYIFWLYKDIKEIFESKDFIELKEGHNWFFNRQWWFYKSNLNNSQLASYLFYHQINLKDNVEKEYILSKIETEEENFYRHIYWYSKRCIYQYSYSFFIESIINNKPIHFDEYIEIIKYYSSIKLIDDYNIKIIYSEILAYIFYYSVYRDYINSVNLIWENLEEYIDKINFYKTIYNLDKLNNTNKINEIIDKDKIDELIEYIVKIFDYPASEVEDYVFIAQLYWLNGNKDIQIKSFDRWIANSYVKYWFRKDYYLTIVFELIEELKEEWIITENKTYKYLDKVIELYWIIDWITEKGVSYLWKYIVKFISKMSIDKAEEYSKKINDINYSYSDEIYTIILIQKIKSNTIKQEEIDDIYFRDDTTRLLELKIYLYLVKSWKKEFIDTFNELIPYINTTSIWYYWDNDDINLYNELYTTWNVNKFDLALEELKIKLEDTEKIISLEWLKDSDIINLLNDKICYWLYHTSYSWDKNYLLKELYSKDRNLFYKYISWTKFKFFENHEYEFFTNINWLNKVYIANNEKEKSIKLIEDLIDFAELLIK